MRAMIILVAIAAMFATTSSALAFGGGGTATQHYSNEPPLRETKKSRRDVLASLLVGVGGGGLIGGSVPDAAHAADDITAPPVPPAASDSKTVFLGTYTDPVNHPGGTRTIELNGSGFAGYQLATVKGGGGRGEPDSYELPAMIFTCPGNQRRGGKWCITIDFTPKGGPKDFQGYYDEAQQGIRFVLDNNFWPKQ